jgi:hypothetical protein
MERQRMREGNKNYGNRKKCKLNNHVTTVTRLRTWQKKTQDLNPSKAKMFIFSTASTQALGSTQLPIQWVQEKFYLGVRALGRESDYSPPSSAEVKNAWSYTSNPPYFFMAWYLRRRKDSVTFSSILKRKEIGRHKLNGMKNEQNVLGRIDLLSFDTTRTA